MRTAEPYHLCFYYTLSLRVKVRQEEHTQTRATHGGRATAVKQLPQHTWLQVHSNVSGTQRRGIQASREPVSVQVQPAQKNNGGGPIHVTTSISSPGTQSSSEAAQELQPAPRRGLYPGLYSLDVKSDKIIMNSGAHPRPGRSRTYKLKNIRPSTCTVKRYVRRHVPAAEMGDLLP
jgi:hypothetical protein